MQPEIACVLQPSAKGHSSALLSFKATAMPLSLRHLAAAVLAAAALAVLPTPATAAAVKAADACDGKFVRPILLVPGFLGVPLFDSANNFDPEWPDFDAFGQQVAPGMTDLDLPMTWKGATQDASAVGPESMPNDKYPSLDSTLGKLFTRAVRPAFARRLCSPSL